MQYSNALDFHMPKPAHSPRPRKTNNKHYTPDLHPEGTISLECRYSISIVVFILISYLHRRSLKFEKCALILMMALTTR